MLKLMTILVNNKNVICCDYDDETKEVSFVIDEYWFGVTSKPNGLYKVVIANDQTGEELEVTVLTLNQLEEKMLSYCQ
jgi:hypothetical protein